MLFMRIFCGYKTDGMFWFRVFGYGLHGKNIAKHELTFSERNGYQKRFTIGSWSFKFLKPLTF